MQIWTQYLCKDKSICVKIFNIIISYLTNYSSDCGDCHDECQDEFQCEIEATCQDKCQDSCHEKVIICDIPYSKIARRIRSEKQLNWTNDISVELNN